MFFTIILFYFSFLIFLKSSHHHSVLFFIFDFPKKFSPSICLMFSKCSRNPYKSIDGFNNRLSNTLYNFFQTFIFTLYQIQPLANILLYSYSFIKSFHIHSIESHLYYYRRISYVSREHFVKGLNLSVNVHCYLTSIYLNNRKSVENTLWTFGTMMIFFIKLFIIILFDVLFLFFDFPKKFSTSFSKQFSTTILKKNRAPSHHLYRAPSLFNFYLFSMIANWQITLCGHSGQ